VKANHKNVTLSLPEPLLQRFRVYAAGRNRSMTNLITELIREAVAEDDEQSDRRRRILARLENPPNLGTNGTITWKRQDLYEDRIRRY
jgi:hypothetical protein